MTAGPSMRALEVFETLVGLEGDARSSAIERACAGDSRLRDEVERMLAVESSGDFLDVDPTRARTMPVVPDAAGTTIGPFTIVRTLGSGGMGVVYEAEQRVPHRRVALKTLASTFVKPRAERRFHSEIQLLARLDHPAIARVLEAGTEVTPDGTSLPYFAMEYVDGARDLVSWAVGRDLEERLELFATVCDAIQHGHQQGVVHRDLKPANVLVDGNGAPKVIDFGVARAVDGSHDDDQQATRTGEIVGTLRYMAPEQLEGSGNVDTRTDVYALGLLLYELVAGKAPYELDDLTLTEVARVIRETPPRPFARLEQPIPEDLGWIVMRALEKEPERRYPSASELAADLRRFLDGSPVEAGRPSRTYALRKLVRRNRVASISVACVVLAILLGTAVSFTSMLRANNEAEKFRAINDVLTGMFAGVRVEEGGADLRAVELLDRASEEVLAFSDRPHLQAALHLTLAQSYESLALHKETEREARRALELAHALEPAERIVAALQLARCLKALDRWAEAGEVAERWIDDPAFSRAEAMTRFGLRRVGYVARAGQGAPAEAADGLGALLAEARAELGQDSFTAVGIEIRLAEAQIAAGRDADAEALLRARIEAGRHAPSSAQQLLDVRFLLTRALARQHRHAEALEMLEDVVPATRATYGAEHARTRVALAGLASSYLMTGDAARAAPIFEAVADAWEERVGPQHSETLTARSNHARALARLGDARAEDLLRGAYEGRERIFGPDDSRTLYGLFQWAHHLRRNGRLDEAEPLLVELVARAERALPERSTPRHRYNSDLGLLRLAQGRPAEASELLVLAWEGFADTEGPFDSETLVLGMNYAGSLMESGRWSESLDVMIGTLADMREEFDEDDPRICLMLSNIAFAHVQRGESRLALARLLDVLEWRNQHLSSDDPRRLAALDRVGAQLLTLERPEEALPYFEELASSIDLTPGLDAEVRSSYRLGYARCLAACGRTDEAEEELATVLEMERARLAGADAAGIARLEEELRALQARR
ncbi:MAG: protein kinase [Planctomycetota bacterium]